MNIYKELKIFIYSLKSKKMVNKGIEPATFALHIFPYLREVLVRRSDQLS